jgi:hypothetical protein
MYIYYALRGTRGDTPTELEGDILEESFPGVKLNNGPAIIQQIVQQTPVDDRIEWTECDLTDDFFNREDTYIFFDGRWMRRADAPWRKDRS